MTFVTLCSTLLALLFAMGVCFAGYRLFLLLLPIWGFFFGFFLGAQSVQLLFNESFLASVTGWVVGFLVGVLFAVLSYLFYMFAVAVIAGSVGYGIGASVMAFLNLDLPILTWIVGIILAIVVIVVTFRFNIQKYVIVAATAIGGAAGMVTTLAVGAQPTAIVLAELIDNPIRVLLDNSFWWSLLFIVAAVAGFVVQVRANPNFTLEEYNNWA